MTNGLFGINDSGEIVGFAAFPGVPWQDGYASVENTLRRLSFPLSQDTAPSRVNNLGQVVGSYTIEGVSHGFLSTPQ